MAYISDFEIGRMSVEVTVERFQWHQSAEWTVET